ncbi:hypothetical protein MMC28_008938 [Mycoblastus sanguinarius]|nr:hypothetical protein [Mycoblastus sanguinarius]
MGISLTFILTYLLGGLTFLPILLCLVLLHAYLTFPEHSSTSSEYAPNSLRNSKDDGRNLKSRESLVDLAEKFRRGHEPDVAAGYFAVCREYVPGGINGKPPERTTPAGAVVAAESPSVYQSMYRSIFDRKQGPSLDPGKGNGKAVKRARNVFFVVLRHGHLMLYEDSDQIEVKHVISLELHDVSIYGGEDKIPEGELWIKRNAIRLVRKAGIEDPISTSKPFFLFSENCSDKEDFYFALLQNQEVKSDAPDNPPRPQQYETKHIIGLVQKLHSSEEQLQTRWINGLAGRLFLGLYKTHEIEDFVRKKITKKIARVKKPAFLSGIVLRKIDMGESAPHITNPRLKDLTIDGDCCAEADLMYSGNFRLEVAATARIDLGARFKAREVNLVLAVVIKKLNGHALVKFKPPPSNRVWVSFETMPDMEMTIEPIVSSRQITYGIILRAIEARIREVMAETVVLPHWDDSPFTDTVHQKFRGGIWANPGSQTKNLAEHKKIPDEALEDEAEAEAEAEVDTALAPPASPRARDERTMSMPVFSDPGPISPTSKGTTSSTHTLRDATKGGVSSSLQKRTEPPKALRSRSFASAANPLLSMDNANVESIQVERKSKQQQDATSAMMAISNRSRPTSPTETPFGSAPDTPTLWEVSKEANSKSSTPSGSDGTNEHIEPQNKLSDSPSQTSSASTPASIRSRSPKSLHGNNPLQTQAPAPESRSTVPSEKRQSIPALGAATAAAKKWGWGVLSRNIDQKNQPDPNRAGTPKHPIGRGRPLPPPGQPLPFPEGPRSKMNTVPTKRKPVPPPPLPQRRHDETKTRPVPPAPLLNRKRQGSAPIDDAGVEGLLVVEAPPESEPSSPSDEKSEDFIDGAEIENGESLRGHSPDKNFLPPEERDAGQLHGNPYDDHASGQQSAQEEAVRLRAYG